MSRINRSMMAANFIDYLKSIGGQYQSIYDELYSSGGSCPNQDCLVSAAAALKKICKDLNAGAVDTSDGFHNKIQSMQDELSKLDVDEIVDYNPESLKPASMAIPVCQKKEAAKLAAIGAFMFVPQLFTWPIIAATAAFCDNRHDRELRYGAPITAFAKAVNQANITVRDLEYSGIPFVEYQASHPVVDMGELRVYNLVKGTYFSKNDLRVNPQAGRLKAIAVRSFSKSCEKTSITLKVYKRLVPGVARRILELKKLIGILSALSMPELKPILSEFEGRSNKASASLSETDYFKLNDNVCRFLNNQLAAIEEVIALVKKVGEQPELKLAVVDLGSNMLSKHTETVNGGASSELLPRN